MDMTRIDSLKSRVVADSGGAMISALSYLGERLGLFEALSGSGPVTSVELARHTELDERYVREWLKAMVAAEYLEHDADGDRYTMTPEQRAVLVDRESPSYVGGIFLFALPSLLCTPRLLEVFRDGGGLRFSELGPEVATAIDRIHLPAFTHGLVQQWLPAVPGLTDRLVDGIDVLDVGCGCGRSTVEIATAFPQSRLLGVDPDAASIEQAREMARRRGAARAEFRVSAVDALPPEPRFDLALAFDCIHDFVDPVGGLRAIRSRLADDGVFLWLEPTGSDDPNENRTPIRRLRAALSPFHCLTVSLAEGGAGLGTLIGETGIRRLAAEAGFSSCEPVPIDDPLQQMFALRV